MQPCCQPRRQPRRCSSTSGAEPRGGGGGRGVPQWLNMAWGCAARPESLSRCLAAPAASLIHQRWLIRAAGGVFAAITPPVFPPRDSSLTLTLNEHELSPSFWNSTETKWNLKPDPAPDPPPKGSGRFKTSLLSNDLMSSCPVHSSQVVPDQFDLFPHGTWNNSSFPEVIPEQQQQTRTFFPNNSNTGGGRGNGGGGGTNSPGHYKLVTVSCWY